MSQIKTYQTYDRRPMLRRQAELSRLIMIVTAALIIGGIVIASYVVTLQTNGVENV